MDITNEIISDFRDTYKAFSDTTMWSNDTITMALCDADAETGGSRWGTFDLNCHNFKKRGMYLFAAHFIAVTYPRGDSSMSGSMRAGVASKSVGDESVSFVTGDVSKLSVGDAWLNSTSFGQQFLRLRKRAGMGALAV